MNILYTDYAEVIIVSSCKKPSTAGTYCEMQYFFVSTRVKSTDLTPDAKMRIRKAINKILNPYCLADQDLSFTKWDSTLPFPACGTTEPTPPAAYTDKVEAIRKELKSESDNANYVLRNKLSITHT